MVNNSIIIERKWIQAYNRGYIMIRVIIDDIVISFIQYVPYAVTTGVIVTTAICIIFSALTRYNMFTRGTLLIKIYIAYIYIFIVAFLTFFSREPGSRNSVDLRLFSTISWDLSYDRYPIENILLFIPLGLLLPFYWRKLKNVISCMGIGFLFSVIIEVGQLVTKRGYFQIDDIITNTLGSLIGACIIMSFITVRNKIDMYMKMKLEINNKITK